MKNEAGLRREKRQIIGFSVALALLSLGLLVSGLGDREGWASAIFFIGALVAASRSLVICANARELRGRLRKYFVLDLPQDRNDLKQIKRLEIGVPKTLRELAGEMARAFEAEIQAQIDFDSIEETGEIDDKHAVLTAATERAREKKSLFWGAHECAREIGLRVKPSYKDYLTHA